ncbi:MAG TPA: hypothetical protein PL033_16635 [Candidatus Brocadiia bacterium]|nr:hypothetical protein [Candidatus Brocadiia bacterium]
MVSRAYYACYLELRAVALANCDPAVVRTRLGTRPEKELGHEKFHGWLMGQWVSDEVREIGELLKDLYGQRLDADYNMNVPMTDANAERVCGDASYVLEQLDCVTGRDFGQAIETPLRAQGSEGRR